METYIETLIADALRQARHVTVKVVTDFSRWPLVGYPSSVSKSETTSAATDRRQVR